MESWQRTAAATQGQYFGMLQSGLEVWITGIGLVSSIGSGVATHWDALSNGSSRVNVDTSTFAPYPVHPLAGISLEGQIQSKADLRQMGRWQQIGVYAAGLALDDAQLKGEAELLSATDLVVAAGNGERDADADAAILKALGDAAPNAATLTTALQTSLRPTLYLGELSNLLAGNISIVHGVTNSSRTFRGEEQAGVAAFRDAASRIWDGTSHMALVGGACNAERHDLHLSLELCNCLWRGDFEPIRRRVAAGGGIIPGSIGSFIVLEKADHARSRGVRPYARVKGVAAERMELLLPQAFRSSGEAHLLIPRRTNCRQFRSRPSTCFRAQAAYKRRWSAKWAGFADWSGMEQSCKTSASSAMSSDTVSRPTF